MAIAGHSVNGALRRHAPALLIDADPEAAVREPDSRVVGQTGDLLRFRHVAREENDAPSGTRGERLQFDKAHGALEAGDQQLSILTRSALGDMLAYDSKPRRGGVYNCRPCI